MYDLLIPMINKRDELKRNYNKSISKHINKEITREQLDIVKLLYRKQEEKITNRMNDLHYKVITKLIREGVSLILIPKLNITQILRNENMPPRTKKIAQIEKPMTFLKRLKEKAKLEGVTVKIVNENMTTQCCGYCFSTKKFEGEVYECDNCKHIFGRDINSARNIYIKELCKMIEVIDYLRTL